MSRRDALAVIAKEPVAGTAKTRLAPALGTTGAARAAAAMLADTVAVVRAVGADPWLCFTPPQARERFGRLAPGFGLLAQAPGDLGDRLAACLADLLAAGAERVAIVGADTPHSRRPTAGGRSACSTRSTSFLGLPLTAATTWSRPRRPIPDCSSGFPWAPRWSWLRPWPGPPDAG
jgi:Uncharacterized protein conserved in bacteria (DUF2064)